MKKFFRVEPKPKILSVWFDSFVENISDIFPNLETASFAKLDLSDDTRLWKALCSLPKNSIKKIIFYHNGFSESSVKVISQILPYFPNLEALYIDNQNSGFLDSRNTDLEFSASLARLPKLKELSLRDDALTDNIIPSLSYLIREAKFKGLILDLSGNALKFEGKESVEYFAASFPLNPGRIGLLDLSKNPIAPNIGFLKNLKSLGKLNIYETGFSKDEVRDLLISLLDGDSGIKELFHESLSFRWFASDESIARLQGGLKEFD